MAFSLQQDWPKISVVTPSLNQSRYLEACISSILEQDYPNLEYLIIDGGSTDSSLEIIQKYAHQLDYWVSEPDHGQSDAINKGFRQATGELVAWLNADDYYLPDALRAVATAYREQPERSFYFGDGYRVSQSGEIKKGYFPGGVVRFSRQALIFGLNFILQPATFIYRPALEQIGYLDTYLHYGMDTDLWIRLSGISEPLPVQAKLAVTREYESTKTSTGSFKRLEELRLIAEKYSGMPVTPGYLCYYLDTLHRFIQQNEDIYPPSYRRDVEAFWASTAERMAHYGVRPDGFLHEPDTLHSQDENVWSMSDRLSSLVRRIKKLLKKFS